MLHPERSIVPADAGQAFLAFLLEDFADEWGTKAMFHYRWYRERDQKQMSEWLAFDRSTERAATRFWTLRPMFRARQVGRMALVGCTPQNAPIIEDERARASSRCSKRMLRKRPYLFGTRPSLADFGWFGQLSQLAVDPTPQEMMRARLSVHLPLGRRISTMPRASKAHGVGRCGAAARGDGRC